MSKSDSNHGLRFDRRKAMLSASAGITAMTAATSTAATKTLSAAGSTCSTPRAAVARTQYGKVRGYIDDGVFTFKGVPYGANTGGENRWLPARPPAAWDGELPTLIYGANCPQRLHTWSPEQSFLYQWTDGWISEDMLKVNIWTPSLSGKRPVMFYIHGGGFSFGSAYELASQDGAQLARHHDVVSVTVNHRLNSLGFLDVSSLGGPAYADSVNVGMTDLVAALRWVRDNIANFGGDPNCVMIYGQSGGGSKVTTLLGMSSAEGLIHRASAQSGGGGNPPGIEESSEYSRRVIADLGVKDMAGLQKLEWARLNEVSNAVAAKMNPPAGIGGPTPIPGTARPRVGAGPTVDGRTITMRSFYDAAPEISKKVPVLFGSVSEEGNVMSSRPTEAQWLATLTRNYGEAKGKALVEALKKAHPEKSIRTLSYMCGGSGLNGLALRNNVTRMATMKHAQNAAPAYAWYFSWQSPMLEDAGAWHTAELAFCFDNTKRCDQGTGNGPQAQALAKKMATAWANFARKGDPSQPGLKWEPFEPNRARTMVFDNNCRIMDDPEGELRKILLS
ncbi:MAG: carboxylesterase family protein [Acidobacteria bacterium]|nr:carboxylesterase family protein [Acidobacteriota bacterium]